MILNFCKKITALCSSQYDILGYLHLTELNMAMDKYGLVKRVSSISKTNADSHILESLCSPRVGMVDILEVGDALWVNLNVYGQSTICLERSATIYLTIQQECLEILAFMPRGCKGPLKSCYITVSFDSDHRRRQELPVEPGSLLIYGGQDYICW
jgi:hypothetical protein